jgi:hypothetical protein
MASNWLPLGVPRVPVLNAWWHENQGVYEYWSQKAKWYEADANRHLKHEKRYRRLREIARLRHKYRTCVWCDMLWRVARAKKNGSYGQATCASNKASQARQRALGKPTREWCIHLDPELAAMSPQHFAEL